MTDNDHHTIDIGVVVQRTGVPTTTLHLWEKRGLLSPAGRDGLRRQYEHNVIERIAIILICQRSGFTLAEIAGVLSPDAFTEGKTQLSAKLDELRKQRAELDQAIDGLEHALSCSHASPLDCPDFKAKLRGILPQR